MKYTVRAAYKTKKKYDNFNNRCTEAFYKNKHPFIIKTLRTRIE